MKFKAIITTRTGETITLDLSCREYHANKLNYILSRTLDRSLYTGAEVVAGFNSPAVEAAARDHAEKPLLIEKKREKKKLKCEFSEQTKNGKEMNCYYFGCLHQIKGDCPILNGGNK